MNLAKKLIPVLRNIKRSIFTNITKFGNLDYNINGEEITITPHQDQSAIRLDDIPYADNFIAEFEVKNTIIGIGNCTFVYRTTSWGTQGIAYGIGIKSGGYLFGRQTNTGGSSSYWTELGNGYYSIPINDWVRFKIIINNNSHKIFINDELKIDIIDGTFLNPGQFGINCYISEQVKIFRNIKITPIL